ncbi:MAG: alpha/beta hydrolase [Clostridia bacterium]|nr:alpha/beta hydrolase [Clostridia bacterium]
MLHDAIPVPLEDVEWLYARDESYAVHDGVELRLQLIFPYHPQLPDDAGFPLILFLPGAAWYRQEMYNSVPQWAKLAERGAVVAAVQVRSSQEAKYPAQVEDALAAMYHLAADAARWHIDPHRMYLCGQSSGGHIALMTVLTSMDELAAAPDFTLRGVIAVSAPTDMQRCGGQPSLDLLGLSDLTEDPARVMAASCGGYITPAAPLPRMLLIHGTADEVVPMTHSQQLYRQLTAAGKRVHFIKVSGAGHGGAWQWKDQLLDSMMQFVCEG